MNVIILFGPEIADTTFMV